MSPIQSVRSSTEYLVNLQSLRCFSVPILNDMSAWTLGSGIEYWINLRPLPCFRLLDIRWYVIRYWNTGQHRSGTEDWLDIQYLTTWIRLTWHSILKHWKHRSGRRLTRYPMLWTAWIGADRQHHNIVTSEHRSGSNDWVNIQCLTA